MKRALLGLPIFLLSIAIAACFGGTQGGLGPDYDAGVVASCVVLNGSAVTQDFGSVPVGQKGTPVLINISNAGTCSSGTLTTAVSGSNAKAFVVDTDGCKGATLPAGAKCSISMHFAPSSQGAQAASLVVTGSSGGSATVSLTGVADVPSLTLLPAMQDFGTVVVGSSSSPTTFTLTNNGTTKTGAISMAVLGMAQEQFRTSNDTCSQGFLDPGKSCSVDVTFTAISMGTKTASLTATVSGSASVQSTLSGEVQGTAAFVVTPDQYDFGPLTVGVKSAPSTFLVKNTGGVPTGTPTVAVAGPNQGDFLIASSCMSPLPANGSCSFVVTFTPSTPQTETATVSVTAPGTTSAAPVGLSGTGLTSAALQLSPMANDFGPVAQGSSSGDFTFTVTNTGATKSGVLTATLGGTGMGQFGFGSDNCTGTQLNGAATCNVSVHFSPNASSYGAIQAQLLVSGTVGGTASATLSGTALTPAAFAIGPAAYDFGVLALGTPSPVQTFTITNSGGTTSGPPMVTQAGSSDFTIVSNTCVDKSNNGIPVPGSNGTCAIGVQFNPSVPASESGTVTVAATPGGAVIAHLSGTGATPATLQITPARANYMTVTDNMSSAPIVFTVTNTGGIASGPLQRAALTGPDAGDFTVVSDGCRGHTLAKNGATACSVTISFTPSTVGTENGTFTESDNQGHDASSFLNGTGVSGAALTVTPAGDFPPVNVGKPSVVTFSISNSGGTASGTVAATVTGNPDFVLTSTTCGQSIAPHASNACDVVVTFTASAPNVETGTLNVSSMPGGTQLPLRGRGLAPAIAIAPATHAFSASASRPGTFPFTVTNGGTAPTSSPLVLSGLPAGGFSVIAAGDTCSGKTLAVNGTCALTVQYQPTSAEAKGATDKATLTVTDSPTDSTQATLTGTVLAPAVTIVSPGVFQASASTPQTKTVTIKNTGNAPTNAISLTGLPAGGFSIPNGTDMCSGKALVVQGMCSFSVQYQPNAMEAANTVDSATLTATDAAPATDKALVTFTGTVLAPAIGIAPASPITFQASATMPQSKTLTVTNNGSAKTNPLAVSGLPANGFSISMGGDLCTGKSLGLRGTCAISVQYQPSPNEAPGAMDSATLTVSDGAPAADSAQATLDGTAHAVAAPQLTFTSGPGLFAPTMNTASFTVKNTGTAKTGNLMTPTFVLTQSSSNVSVGNFKVSSGDCGPALDPGSSCTYSIAFTPPTAEDAGSTVAGFAGSTSISDSNVSATAAFSGIYP